MENETNCKQKFVHVDNLRQNIWSKVKKSSQVGQKQQSLITASAQFLTAIRKVSVLDERLDTRLEIF